MTTKHTPTFPTGLMMDRGQIVGPMGDFYGCLSDCTVTFAHQLIERSNAHDELVAALREIADELGQCNGGNGPTGGLTVHLHVIARAALAKVQQ